MTDFRCSGSSRDDAEPMAGSAPTDERLLLVEYAGPWPREAVRDGRLAAPLAAWVQRWSGWKTHVIRRHHHREPGLRVFAWQGGRLGGVVVDGPDDVTGLDPATLPAHHGDLWLVCTNGARDRCCVEQGRPIVAALTERWPEETWEINHLGGHRFAGTMLHLPSGWTLGRLDPASAVAAVADVRGGAPAPEVTRGRAGRPGAVQVAELALRVKGASDVVVRAIDASADEVEVLLVADGRDARVVVHQWTGEPRRQSCADLRTKPAQQLAVRTIDW